MLAMMPGNVVAVAARALCRAVDYRPTSPKMLQRNKSYTSVHTGEQIAVVFMLHVPYLMHDISKPPACRRASRPGAGGAMAAPRSLGGTIGWSSNVDLVSNAGRPRTFSRAGHMNAMTKWRNMPVGIGGAGMPCVQPN